MKFSENVIVVKKEPITALESKILQVNLGYMCNMECKHCHVSGGPARTQSMNAKTAECVLKVFLNNPFETLDLTGGAPELNPLFRMLVTEARKAGRNVIARTNLTIFFEKTMEDLAEFYRDQRVELVASLPYYLEDGVDRVRGSGAYMKSIEALKRLNTLGYGTGSPDLPLSLVFNPQGIFLAPPQNTLENDYKQELQAKFGIQFTHLYTILNMPVGRFKDFLSRTNNLDKYRERLASAFNPATLDGVMCRYTVNVGWDGRLFDCDFNQALGLTASSDVPQHIDDFDYQAFTGRKITVGDHCYGCTAGQGSSCAGAVT
jgi:radical SAM/Cys-rich protein